MKKKKLLKFAAWLREQPNTRPHQFVVGETERLFTWFSSYKCVATYAAAWAGETTIPSAMGTDPKVFKRLFNVTSGVAYDLFTAGARITTKRGHKRLHRAKLTKVADVIEHIADGFTVDNAIVAVFGKDTFLKERA